MFPRRISALASAALVILAGTACASRQTAEQDPGAAVSAQDPAADAFIQVDVNHNRSDGGIATIYIEPAAGVRLTLGTINPGERKTFPYRVEAQNRTVRLLAINASGQTMTSSQITVPRGAGLTWDLQINSVRVKR